MARVKIDIPEKFQFRTEIPIRISDINYGGHLGNDSVLSICQEARIQLLNQFGFSELDIDGSGIIMVDATVQYKSEGFYGDVLLVEVTITDVTKIGCDFVYRISNKKNQNEVAIVKTGIVFFDYEKKKVVSVPSRFAEIIGKHGDEIN
ncbi:thioesterase family protein [bacterium BMS3Abin03]|nr:thioesterase family protein [bacterium BMS3Abin03]MCG6959519.1 thioesterase family protein [bacterium BMS3Abin03]